MTTYSREQIKSALRDAEEATATCGGEHVGDPEEHRVDALATALGLTVEDPKPEPGIYLSAYGLTIVGSEGGAWVLSEDNRPMRLADEAFPSDPKPARVVPADESSLPSAKDVWNAIAPAPRTEDNRITATAATDAVMALLESKP